VSQTLRSRLCLLLCLVLVLFANQGLCEPLKKEEFISLLREDYKNFYSKQTMSRLSWAFAIGAIPANTKIDHQFHSWYQDSVRSEASDDFSAFAKTFGESKILIPLSLAFSSRLAFNKESKIGQWGGNTARAYMVGVPATLFMQRMTGASRPEETVHKSSWKPTMYPDNNAIKYSAYSASFLTAWSRVNDGDHYLSQAILGWYVAFESMSAVTQSNKRLPNFSLVGGSDGFAINYQRTW